MTHRVRTHTFWLLAAAVAAAAAILSGCSANRAAGEAGAGTGAATSEKSSTTTIKDGGDKSLAELLRNKFPGVDVTQVAGGGIRVKIRNSGLTESGGDPLYIVDGVEVATPDGTLYIDPNNIAKIEVDKGVTALYGIKGANGVVKITTKR
jgi:outer membrane receptor protein involved in Fe transport